ncbi:DUF2341 domain-containing protein [Patescibacteria group bacterium]|nr:DUF2341 domain-containing protein [Patescibacteria group bacterium]
MCVLQLRTGWTLIIPCVFALLFSVFPESAEATWLAGWDYRKTITIDNTNVDADLSSFPLYVKINNDTDLTNATSSTGADIRFTTSTGVTISYEKEEFVVSSGSGTGHFWVKVPDVSSSTGTVIYMYYGGADKTDGEDATNVWDANFKGVWHMSETLTNVPRDETISDSTGTNNGTMTDIDGDSNEATGKVDGAIDFNGDADLINCGADNSLSVSNLTVSFWVYEANSWTGSPGLVDKSRDSEWDIHYSGGIRFQQGLGGRVTGPAISSSNWTYVTVTYDASVDPLIYYNATSQSLTDEFTPAAIPDNNEDLLLGARHDGGYLDGILDEVRVSNTVRSADWIKFEYNNMNESDQELAWSSQAQQDVVAPTISSVSSDTTNGTYGVGSIIDIDVTFSESVTSSGNVTVTLETGDTDRTCTFTVSNASTGTCNYTVQAGDASSDLTVSSITGSIDDQFNNAMTNFVPTTNLAANKAIVIEATAPTVDTLSPTDGATSVAVDTGLVMTFSESIGYTGSGYITIYNSSNAVIEQINTATGSVTGSGTATITINPTSNLANGTSYYVQIEDGAFKDSTGNNYAGIADTTTWNFTTVSAGKGSAGRLSRERANNNTRNFSKGWQSAQATDVTTQSSFVPDYSKIAQLLKDKQERSTETGSTSTEFSYKTQAVRSALLARFQGQLLTRRVQEEESTVFSELISTEGIPGSDAARKLMRAQVRQRVHGSAMPRTAPAQIAERRGLLAALVDDVEVLYRDVPVDAWFAPYVSSLIEEEIATGYENEQGEPIGEFGVSNPVTYAEVLKMSLEAVGVSLQSGTSRNISAQGTWADAYVAYGESEGISVLTPSLNVHESSTRGAVIQIMLEAMGILIGPKSETSYTDVSPNHPYARAIATATFIELIEGDSDTSGNKLNTFRPDEPINRAEVAKIVAIAKELLH